MEDDFGVSQRALKPQQADQFKLPLQSCLKHGAGAWLPTMLGQLMSSACMSQPGLSTAAARLQQGSTHPGIESVTEVPNEDISGFRPNICLTCWPGAEYSSSPDTAAAQEAPASEAPNAEAAQEAPAGEHAFCETGLLMGPLRVLVSKDLCRPELRAHRARVLLAACQLVCSLQVDGLKALSRPKSSCEHGTLPILAQQALALLDTHDLNPALCYVTQSAPTCAAMTLA